VTVGMDATLQGNASRSDDTFEEEGTERLLLHPIDKGLLFRQKRKPCWGSLLGQMKEEMVRLHRFACLEGKRARLRLQKKRVKPWEGRCQLEDYPTRCRASAKKEQNGGFKLLETIASEPLRGRIEERIFFNKEKSSTRLLVEVLIDPRGSHSS